MKVLAIIAARGGSKGVPGKNIALLDGIPLLQYAIEAARQSRLLSRYVVSTDDEDIARLARQLEAHVILRPAELATDTAPITLAMQHAVGEASLHFNESFEAIMLLQPTAPLRRGVDLDAAITLLQNQPHAHGVISVIALSDIHPARMYRVVPDTNAMVPLEPNGETARRQDLPPVYLRNGCIYLVRNSILKEQHTLMPENKLAYIMDEAWWLNIDTPRDLLTGEIITQAWKKHFGITY